MILSTARLTISHFTFEDAPFIVQLLNTDGWKRFISNSGINSVPVARIYLQRSVISSYEYNGYGLYKVSLTKTGETIGMCGIVNRPTLDAPDLGFAILPEHGHKGYTFEASTAILQHARRDLGFQSVLAITTADNVFSIKLLQKLGFKHHGQQQDGTETLQVYHLNIPVLEDQPSLA